MPILGVPAVRGNECVNQTLFQTRVPAQPARWPGPCCDALPRLLLRQLGFLKQSQTSDTEWRINNWYGTKSPLTTVVATNSKWDRATSCIPTEDCSDQNFAICEIAARRENLATSTWREAKWSDTLQITDDMVHTFYKWHGHQDCKFDNVYDVLMVVRFSNLMGEFRWE